VDCSAVVVGGQVNGRWLFKEYIFEPPRDQGLELDLDATVGRCVDELIDQYSVQRIVADPMLLITQMQRWTSRGLDVREYRNQWKEAGPDSMALLAAVQNGLIVHNGSSEYRKHMHNMRVRYGPESAWRWGDHPRKKLRDGSVPNDAGIASMMLAGELFNSEGQSLYASRGILLI
jgi:hypothetical protein